jgi:hypothetical protein
MKNHVLPEIFLAWPLLKERQMQPVEKNIGQD